jgi:S-adenosyl methyltransferase
MPGRNPGEDALARDKAPEPGFDTRRPHPARIYDYWLNGKDNFAADRDAAEQALARVPEYRDYAVGNRKFLTRAVRLLASSGIRQFLDLGTGLPTSPNVHEVAQATDPPEARVVYVDNDPIVEAHAQALLATSPATLAIRADFREVGDVLGSARTLLDFTQPVALMFVASLHHVEDGDDPAGTVARYIEVAPPGSYLVVSHCTDDMSAGRMRTGAEEARRRGLTFVPRSRAGIRRLFVGRELIEPGLVQVSYWRPDGKPDANADRVFAYGGIARI